jgi:hypothetical protein
LADTAICARASVTTASTAAARRTIDRMIMHGPPAF